ncbi:MAG: RsmB/NOP family class I SAM-dependent RNA methyltransferase [Pseudomonadota bacterium]
MTPAARVAASIDVLDKILAGAPAEKALTNWARGARYAGSKDRAAVRDFVYQALRCRDSYGLRGGGQRGALTARQIMIGQLRASGSDPAAFFTGEKFAPSPLSEAELYAPSEAATSLAADLPDWLWVRFVAALGERAAAEMAERLRHRAPITARVNTRKTTRAALITELAKDGISAAPVQDVSTALHLTQGARRLTQISAYLTGQIELQDAHSQAAMAALDVPDGAHILDLCAGGGGKTLALAARLDARYFAHDSQERRLRDLPERARRAGISVNVLATGELAHHGPYDLVLCDVPCSGSGTWRRTPEAKWTLTLDRLEALGKSQADILAQARSLTRPGGSIAYATCSVLDEENNAQITGFCDKNPGWTCGFSRSWPLNDQGDGFYLAVLHQPQG